jgi:hypothetical protein
MNFTASARGLAGGCVDLLLEGVLVAHQITQRLFRFCQPSDTGSITLIDAIHIRVQVMAHEHGGNLTIVANAPSGK